MHTEITFVDGKAADFDETADVKMTPHGVEVLQRDGDEQVRVLFPWARIDRVTQRGINVAAIYTYLSRPDHATRRGSGPRAHMRLYGPRDDDPSRPGSRPRADGARDRR